jgi:hypothetical protein
LEIDAICRFRRWLVWSGRGTEIARAMRSKTFLRIARSTHCEPHEGASYATKGNIERQTPIASG